MPRPRNPLSKRNRNATFTGAEVARVVEREVARLGASKKARVVREKGEFNTAALAAAVAPRTTQFGVFAWSLTSILAARDAQMVGSFKLAAEMARAFNTDDAIFTARAIRLAPVQSLDVRVLKGSGPQAESIRSEASALFGAKGISFSRPTENSIRSNLVDHGIAFGVIRWTPRSDGSRLDPAVTAWPMDDVRWDAMKGCYMAQYDAKTSAALGVFEEPIIHGNGRWIIFQKSELLPHASPDATLIPAALVWPAHAFANRDRRKSSASHGNAKFVGELPAGDALTDESGNPTPEAQAMLVLLEALASQESPFGIRPPGSKTEILANPSGMWQVFSELAKDSEKAAARIYLGSDGILGAQGGAPGVDVTALFGLHSVKIQSDMTAINDGLQSGLIAPWTALNFGDSRQAPTREYVFPDPDRDEVRKTFAAQNAAFLAALKEAKALGVELTPDYVADLAGQYGVPVPKLLEVSAPPAAAPSPGAASSRGTAPAPSNDVAA